MTKKIVNPPPPLSHAERPPAPPGPPRTGRMTEEVEPLPCRDCDGSGKVFVKRDRHGRVDYLSGRVVNNETTRCDRCKGEGVEP